MNDRPVARASVLEIAPYIPGKADAAGGRAVHKLSSNETPLGPSAAAVEAFAARPAHWNFIPTARRGRCARRWPALTA